MDSTLNDTPLPQLSDIGPNFTPCTLPEIQRRLQSLMDELPSNLPSIPSDQDKESTNANNHSTSKYDDIHSFASQLQVVIEQYNLLLSLVGSSTYKWGVDRSGASQQNLSVMVSDYILLSIHMNIRFLDFASIFFGMVVYCVLNTTRTTQYNNRYQSCNNAKR